MGLKTVTEYVQKKDKYEYFQAEQENFSDIAKLSQA